MIAFLLYWRWGALLEGDPKWQSLFSEVLKQNESLSFDHLILPHIKEEKKKIIICSVCQLGKEIFFISPKLFHICDIPNLIWSCREKCCCSH